MATDTTDPRPDEPRTDGTEPPTSAPRGRGHGKDRSARHAPGRRRDVVRVAADLLTVRRAFGEPVRSGGITIVPVAKVLGGAGSGWGSGELGAAANAPSLPEGSGSGSGGGGGFGVRVKPVGVYVVDGAQVTWRPALDLNRVILGGQLVGAVAVTVIAWAVRARRRRR